MTGGAVTCGWKVKGKVCGEPAFVVREVPDQGWQPVCRRHAELVDARARYDRGENDKTGPDRQPGQAATPPAGN